MRNYSDEELGLKVKYDDDGQYTRAIYDEALARNYPRPIPNMPSLGDPRYAHWERAIAKAYAEGDAELGEYMGYDLADLRALHAAGKTLEITPGMPYEERMPRDQLAYADNYVRMYSDRDAAAFEHAHRMTEPKYVSTKHADGYYLDPVYPNSANVPKEAKLKHGERVRYLMDEFKKGNTNVAPVIEAIASLYGGTLDIKDGQMWFTPKGGKPEPVDDQTIEDLGDNAIELFESIKRIGYPGAGASELDMPYPNIDREREKAINRKELLQRSPNKRPKAINDELVALHKEKRK